MSMFRSQPVPDDSQGKSSAKFYQSYDRLFIIKTLTSEEVERMHSFLKQYHPVSNNQSNFKNCISLKWMTYYMSNIKATQNYLIGL